ncbi:hypothetical protein FRC03_010938 [Tulasnella sp. 419]|nr:hypothetical protein FRC03_010938 [Tulasnella sp. 419]
MMAQLPSSSSSSASDSLPFYNEVNGTFNLPPLADTGRSYRAGSLVFETLSLDARESLNMRSQSGAESTTYRDSSPASLSSHSSSSRSPSPATPTLSGSNGYSKPAFPQNIHTARRPSIPTGHGGNRAPAFKLVPQPPLDPSKRPITRSDALVVFPPSVAISTTGKQQQQKKAKLLVGADVETFFLLQKELAQSNPDAPQPRAYAYRIIWDQRLNPSFVKSFSKAQGSGNFDGRRRSVVNMITE